MLSCEGKSWSHWARANKPGYRSSSQRKSAHQALGKRMPVDPVTVIDPSKSIAVKSVLGGLDADYRRAV
jgi:hypothetical protein